MPAAFGERARPRSPCRPSMLLTHPPYVASLLRRFLSHVGHVRDSRRARRSNICHRSQSRIPVSGFLEPYPAPEWFSVIVHGKRLLNQVAGSHMAGNSLKAKGGTSARRRYGIGNLVPKSELFCLVFVAVFIVLTN